MTPTGAGKGDSPRNLGPKFRENYDLIDWQREVDPVAEYQKELGDYNVAVEKSNAYKNHETDM